MPEQIYSLNQVVGPEVKNGKGILVHPERRERQTKKISILKFISEEGEECFLSYTLGFEHGPGIKRDGKGSPTMERLGKTWEDTADADLQRLGTWFIDEKRKGRMRKRTNDVLKKAEKEQKQEREVEKWKLIQDGIPRQCVPPLREMPVHEQRFKDTFKDLEIIGVQGCGDLTMNLWNVAYINSPLTDNEPKLLYLRREPIENRIYSCLIKWKADESHPHPHYTIEPLRFDLFLYEANPQAEGVVLRLRNGGVEPIAAKIEFAIYGQQVIRNGQVNLKNTILEHSDIRHLFLLPNLNPPWELPGVDEGPPRFIYGEKRDKAIWFGEAQLIGERNLQKAALYVPLELSRLYEGMGISKDHIRKMMEGVFRGEDYCEETTHLRPLEKGEWRFLPEDDNLVEIYFKPNTFACTMIGLDRGGDILTFACNGNPGQVGYPPYGTSLETAADLLIRNGAVNALLIDEGADVFQKACIPQTGNDLVEQIPIIRGQLRAVFIFAREGVKEEL
jgi:hypothetical protein